MRPFTYLRAADEVNALGAARAPGARFLAGGTTLVDLMRIGVEAPATVIDIGGLPLAGLTATPAGVRIGALMSNTDVAVHPTIVRDYPALAQALLAGASTQLRNMATVGGNLMQRTRCPYFREPTQPCNKRDPGSGCPAWDGYNRSHAVLGGSEHCIATHPSDMCVALLALDAVIHIHGVGRAPTEGNRTVAIGDFHVVPGAHPEVETVLAPGDLIAEVELTASPMSRRSVYVKVRDRASYAFALASAAVALDLAGKHITAARVALGGLATKPWRSPEAEAALTGNNAEPAVFARAADAALAGAVPRTHNAFKIELGRRTLIRALELAAGVRS